MKFLLSSLRGTRFRLSTVLKQIESDSELNSKLWAYVKSYNVKPDQALYHLVYPKARSTCLAPDCHKTTTYRRNGDTWGYNKYCDNTCCQRDPKYQAQVKKTYRTNPENAFVKDKIEATMLKRYGVKTALADPTIMERRRNTLYARFGVRETFHSPEIIQKRTQTYLDKYGVDHPLKDPGVQRRKRARQLKKHGVTDVMQLPAVFDKAQHNSRRVHTFNIQGHTFQYQGYEHYAIKVLVRQLGVDPKCITTAAKNMPLIYYKHHDRIRRYFPDIRLKHKGRDVCIEVKSVFTCGANHYKTFLAMKRKARAASENGIKLLVWIVFPESKRIARFSNLHSLSFSEFKAAL